MEFCRYPAFDQRAALVLLGGLNGTAKRVEITQGFRRDLDADFFGQVGHLGGHSKSPARPADHTRRAGCLWKVGTRLNGVRQESRGERDIAGGGHGNVGHLGGLGLWGGAVHVGAEVMAGDGAAGMQNNAVAKPVLADTGFTAAGGNLIEVVGRGAGSIGQMLRASRIADVGRQVHVAYSCTMLDCCLALCRACRLACVVLASS